MTSIKKAVGFGFLTWLIPFIVSFAFYTPDGQVRIALDLFKSIMVVISMLVGSLLQVRYFKNVKASYVKEGVIIGLMWLAMNLALDLLILLPMSKMSAHLYLIQIGLRYLTIPILGITFGLALQQKSEQR